MGQCAALGFPGVRKERAGSTDCRAQVLAVVASEILDAELRQERAAARVGFEVPWGSGAKGAGHLDRQRRGLVVEDFGRGKTLQLGGKGMPARDLAHAEFAG